MARVHGIRERVVRIDIPFDVHVDVTVDITYVLYLSL